MIKKQIGITTENVGYRILVNGPRDQKAYIEYDDSLNTFDNHVMAAYRACDQFNIGMGNLQAARLPDDSGFMFVLAED